MRLRILGAAAGGGLPQWNCGCRNCADARDGRIPSMTQSSVAVSADGLTWVVLNASPDIRAQMQAEPALHPRSLRGTPMGAVILTNGDIDHIAGLLTLREGTPFALHGTKATLAILDEPVFRVLDRSVVRFLPIRLDEPFSPAEGLTVTAFAVPGKVALFLEEEEPDTAAMGEQTVGLRLEDADSVVFYIPGCAQVTDDLCRKLDGADLLLFDGTVWQDEEMRRTGTGTKTGARMGHVPMSGPDGSLARLADFAGRRVYIHINNTNPVLQPASAERAEVAAAGWSLAFDGMEITT